VSKAQAAEVASDMRPSDLRIKKLGASLSPLGLKDFFIVGLYPDYLDKALKTLKK
jgi:hypothetical protein